MFVSHLSKTYVQRQAAIIMHSHAGYDKPITGKTAEERLDIRASTKSDKFCK
jgi:hypothetical protein